MHLSCCCVALLVGSICAMASESTRVDKGGSARLRGATVSGPALEERTSAFVAGAGREITVMNLNTFFIKFPRAPKISARARMLSQWFRALPAAHVPDVVVFNEMWHGEFIQFLCHKGFVVDNMFWGRGATNVTLCADDSPFGAVTPVANDRTFPLPISSGVIILTKKGVTLEWRPDWDYEYESSGGVDSLASKGAQLVKVTLPERKGVYYVVGTHLQAHAKHADVRAQQLIELVAFLEDKVPAKHPVIVAGDLNVKTSEISSMMHILTRNGTNVEPSGLSTKGFWAHNDPPLNTTWSASNHFLDDNVTEWRLDWVIPLAMDANRLVATSWMQMMYQYVAVRAPECYAADINDEKRYVSDLADHYAVVAHICDELHATSFVTKGVLMLPNPRCPTAIPSDDKVTK